MPQGYAIGSQQLDRPSQPARESQVNREVLGMGDHAEQIHNLLTALEERLTSVLRPTPPTIEKAASTKDPSEPSVPLAHAAWELNKRFELVRARLGDLMERLEV